MTTHIDVWMINLRRTVDDAALSGDERARAARLVMPDARQRFVASRTELREILGRTTGVDAAALTFAVGEHGKPYLSGIDDAPQFNLAHSGDLALVAVSDRPVGVDLELVRPLANMAQMADMSFTDEERMALWALDEITRTAAFFQLWTRKEAVMKAHGAGFRLAKMFSLPVETTRGSETKSQLNSMLLDGRMFALSEFDAAAGFVAAIAVETDRADDQLRIIHHTL